MNNYITKALLEQEGTLVVKCKVRSIYGETLEEGRSTSINVVRGRKFMLSSALTQVIFGHLKHTDSQSYRYLASNSGDDNFLNYIKLDIKIINYFYIYNTYNVYKYKQIIYNRKRYVQKWEKKGGKYYFSSRTKVKYDNRKKLNKLKDDINVV